MCRFAHATRYDIIESTRAPPASDDAASSFTSADRTAASVTIPTTLPRSATGSAGNPEARKASAARPTVCSAEIGTTLLNMLTTGLSRNSPLQVLTIFVRDTRVGPAVQMPALIPSAPDLGRTERPEVRPEHASANLPETIPTPMSKLKVLPNRPGI